MIADYLGCLSLAGQAFRSLNTPRFWLLVLLFTLSLITGVLTQVRSRLAFPALWLQFAVRALVTFLNARMIWSLHENYPTRTHDITNQIGGMGVIIAWLLYFHYSKRVRETFGTNL